MPPRFSVRYVVIRNNAESKLGQHMDEETLPASLDTQPHILEALYTHSAERGALTYSEPS